MSPSLFWSFYSETSIFSLLFCDTASFCITDFSCLKSGHSQWSCSWTSVQILAPVPMSWPIVSMSQVQLVRCAILIHSCDLLHTPTFHIQHCPDVAGTEACGALKNVIALHAGVVEAIPRQQFCTSDCMKWPSFVTCFLMVWKIISLQKVAGWPISLLLVTVAVIAMLKHLLMSVLMQQVCRRCLPRKA